MRCGIVYSTHFASRHTKNWADDSDTGYTPAFERVLQTTSIATERGQPPPSCDQGEPNARKRLAFECLHKGGGWTAVSLGMLNVMIGVVLIHLKGYDGITVGVALTGACMGALSNETHQKDYVLR